MPTSIRVVVAALLLLSLLGLRVDWLPAVGVLAAVLVVLHVAEAAWAARARLTAAALGEFLERRGFEVAVLTAASAGLGFRLLELDLGLGHFPTDIDEQRLADSVLFFLRTGTVDHSTVEHYPGLHFWVLTASFVVTYLWGLMTGVGHSLASMPVEMFVYAGRVTNVCIEAGTIVLTGYLGRAVSRPAVGVAAAVVVAVSPLAVELSSQLRNEAGLAFFVVASACLAMKALDKPDVRIAAASGVLAGCAAAIKYSGVFAAGPAVVAALVAPAGTRLRMLAAIIAGAAVAVGVTNHFIWADMPNFIEQLATEVAMTGPGHWSAQTNPQAFYGVILADWAVGWPLLILAGVAAAWGLASNSHRLWVLVAFPLPYIWFMSQQPAQFSRWVYPLTPFVAVAGAVGLWWLHAAAGRTARLARRPRLRQVVAWGLVLVGLLPVLVGGARQFTRRLRPATHFLAEAWLAERLPRGASILSEHGWLELDTAAFQVTRVPDIRLALAERPTMVAAHGWVVVPETAFNADSSRLDLAREFKADQGFFGNRGIDVRIHIPRPLQPVDAGVIDVASPEAAQFIGPEWRPDDSGLPGLAVPGQGGLLFIPAPRRADARIELDLWTGTREAAGAVPVEIELAGRPIALEVVSSDGQNLRARSETVPPDVLAASASILRVTRVGREPVRLVRFFVQ
ncbi:MAG TPA: glycosyltransferase family 39 protein [Vicinamibacterales bacterium]|nr:glycosyltransferase family 39 protein [Vicinamibacterales bacterium]